MEKGVSSFINGDEQEPILGATPTTGDLKTFKEWHAQARKVMCQLFINVLNPMIVHIQDANAKGGIRYISKDVQNQYHCMKDVAQTRVA